MQEDGLVITYPVNELIKRTINATIMTTRHMYLRGEPQFEFVLKVEPAIFAFNNYFAAIEKYVLAGGLTDIKWDSQTNTLTIDSTPAPAVKNL